MYCHHLELQQREHFGQLVRRFGILWCYNSSHLEYFSLMVIVCAKLHNLCAYQCVVESKKGIQIYPTVLIFLNTNKCQLATYYHLMQQFGNKFQLLGERAVQKDIRLILMNDICDAGIRITSDDDLLGLPISFIFLFDKF